MALLLCTLAAAQNTLVCDFQGVEPALNTPWTATLELAPNLSYSGWELGAGIVPASGIDDALAFSVDATATDPGSTLAEAIRDQQYLHFTLSPNIGTMDLGGMQIQLTTGRLDWHSATEYSIFSSIDGFAEGQQLFTTEPQDKSTLWHMDHSFIFPLSGYDGIAAPVEFRIYAHGAQFGGHRTTIQDFGIVDPGPVHSMTLSSDFGGDARTQPAGDLFVAGSQVVLHSNANPGFRFGGWQGDVSGTGNPRTITMDADKVIHARFTELPPRRMHMAMNLGYVNDWMSDWMFVDQMKAARVWMTRSVGGTEWDSGMAGDLPRDADGWPLQIPFTASDGNQHTVHTILPTFISGDHTLIVEGTGVIQILGTHVSPPITLSGGTTTVTIPATIGVDTNFFLHIQQSAATDPVRNLRLIMPGFESTYQTQPFHPLYLQRLAPFTNLRFMDTGAINHSWVDSWDERALPTDYTQASHGVAMEWMIQLSNQLQTDAWLCIPHQADDDYVRRTAMLWRDNLDPALKLYVEYSNETWNPIFTQTSWVADQGEALGLHGDRWHAGQYFVSLRSAQIWEIFEQEFGDPARLVKVMATQSSNTYVSQVRVQALNSPATNPNYVMPDALAIAPYFGHNFTPAELPPNVPNYPTVDEIIHAYSPAAIDGEQIYVQQQKQLADQQGMSLICYEGGQHFVGIFGAENDAQLTQILNDANRHPQMYDRYVTYLDMLNREGVELFANYSFVDRWSRYGSWGALEYMDQPLSEAPKYRALIEWAPLTIQATPTTLDHTTGGIVDFSLSGGLAHAGNTYVIGATSAGTLPGVAMPNGQTAPLNRDAVFDHVHANLGQPGFVGFTGQLDAAGNAHAQLDTMGPLPASLAGRWLHFAFATLQPWGYASNTAAVQVN